MREYATRMIQQNSGQTLIRDYLPGAQHSEPDDHQSHQFDHHHHFQPEYRPQPQESFHGVQIGQKEPEAWSVADSDASVIEDLSGYDWEKHINQAKEYLNQNAPTKLNQAMRILFERTEKDIKNGQLNPHGTETWTTDAENAMLNFMQDLMDEGTKSIFKIHFYKN